MSLIVLTPKGPSLCRTTSFELSVYVGRAVRAGRWIEKTRTVEDRTRQDSTGKSHKRVIFHLFGEKPQLKRSTSKIFSRWRPRRSLFTWAKFQNEIFRGYSWSNFPFSYWFLNAPYNNAAILRCLWFMWNMHISERALYAYAHSCLN